MEFDEFLLNENGRKLFMNFLRKEFSEENLEFWLQCQRLKYLSNDKSLLEKSIKKIYDEYISLKGTKTINIDCDTLKSIRQNIHQNNFSINIYDDAVKHIYQLMKNDSYQRFVKTEEYKNFVNFINIKQSSNRKRRKSIVSIDDYRDHRFSSPRICIYENSPILNKKWSNQQFIKIILPDGSYEFISILQQRTIGSIIESLLQRKSMENYCYKIISIADNQEIESTRLISSLIKTDLRIERIINFTLNFPEGYRLQIETNPKKLAYYAIKLILEKFAINIHDVELASQNGTIFHVNGLLQSSSILDNCQINVKYLSSLRTFLNIGDFNDLNQLIAEDIIIKSVKFHKIDYHEQNSRNEAFDYFTVDNCQATNDENINIENLSFSSDTTTEKLLQTIMKTNNETKINFNHENDYENLSTTRGDLHHARFVYINSDDTGEPYYENNEIILKQQQSRQDVNNHNPTIEITPRCKIRTLSRFHKFN